MADIRPARGRGTLDEADLIRTALEEMERVGLEAFSLRSVARIAGCDPAALIYRFGSKEGLERRVADHLHEAIRRPSDGLDWQDHICRTARQYRDLARRYPRTFPLLLRFWTTGPKDLAGAEEWYRALSEAGVPDDVLPALECGLYAMVLGLCAGEAGGLVGLPSPEIYAEIESGKELQTMRRLLPAITRTGADEVFEETLKAMLLGIAALADGAPAPCSAPPRKRIR